ncbi:MAG: ATP phosphoribosyltransferase regulatory subunit [Ahrensia sp.]|nr:ATP phosphoribosyltransferase regulatory subunit [Ahrensia sp.]
MAAHKSFSARADIEAILASRDAVRTDVAVLQPADPFLDTAGEELRRRIFLTQGGNGAAMCLRPEFTIPVCLKHINSGAAHGRYGYVGTVFRQRPNGSSEFLQAGIEDIGDRDVMTADARSLADSLACLDALGAPKNSTVIIGDQAVFDAVLTALGLPSGWRVRLSHAFGDDGALNAALDKLAEPAKLPTLPDDVQAAIAHGQTAVCEVIQSHMDAAGLTNSGGRTAQEIAKRLVAKAGAVQDVDDAPRAEKLAVLRQFLRLRAPMVEATAMLEAFEQEHGLNISGALAAFAKRNAAFVAAGINLRGSTYSASFGRSLDYYSGLIFEVRAASGEVLVGGGRYDKLLPLLGAKEPTTGVGFSLWLDRIAQVSR